MKSRLQVCYWLVVLTLLMMGMFYSCKKEQSSPGDTQATKPEITSIQPKNPQPGDVVTISGTNFGTVAADVKVTIGNTEIPIASVTATEIKFTIPASLNSGSLALAIKGVLANNKDNQGATITVTPKPLAVPTFTAMSPSSGRAGDVVTLTGANFNTQLSENKVFFATATGGTVVLATVKSATATQLTVEVPGGAITGGVSITVSGNNAIPATGFNTTFTINADPGSSAGSNVDYVQVVTGKMSFNKIGTSANEISTMWFDKVKNVLYYSDYSLLVQTGNKVYKLDPGGNNPAQVLTGDARITNIVKIATDVTGNVYTLKTEGSPGKYSLYKISVDGSTVTEIKTNFSIVSGSTGRYFLFVNANNEICIRPNFRIKQNGDVVTTTNDLPGLQQGTEGAVFNSNTAYIAYTTDNSGYANNCVFAKWDLNDGSTSNTSFTLKTLFDDDADRTKSTRELGDLRYAVDDNDNFYAMIDKSASATALARTWVIRKAKNGASGYTTLGSFYIKFPTPDMGSYTSAVPFVADARGNLYIRVNLKDIVRISF